MKIATFIDLGGCLAHPKVLLSDDFQFASYVKECIDDLSEQFEVVVLDRSIINPVIADHQDQSLRLHLNRFVQIFHCNEDCPKSQPPDTWLFKEPERILDLDLKRSFLVSRDPETIMAANKVGLRAVIVPMFSYGQDISLNSFLSVENVEPRPIFVGDLRDAIRILTVKEFRER